MITIQNRNKDIIQLLDNKLITPNQESITKVFDDFDKYYTNNLEKKEIRSGSIHDFSEPLQSYLSQMNVTSVGIDLPAFISLNTHAQSTIMVCAMDPLTPMPTKLLKEGTVGLGIPFDVMELGKLNGKAATGSLVHNKNFFERLLSQYDLYVTDIYKVFFREIIGENKHRASNAISSFKNLSITDKENKKIAIHSALLCEEINFVKPELIITLGNAARNALVKLNNSVNKQQDTIKKWDESNDANTAPIQQYLWKGNQEIPIFSLPHISNAANGVKNKILKHYGYPTSNASTHMASIVLDLISKKL
jgi:hypothetical protein